MFFFFFNDTATTEIYTLSLHDALPICSRIISIYDADGVSIGHIPCPMLKEELSSSAVFCPKSELLLVRSGCTIEAYDVTTNQGVWHTSLCGVGEMACDTQRGILYASTDSKPTIMINALDCRSGQCSHVSVRFTPTIACLNSCNAIRSRSYPLLLLIVY